LSWVKILKLIFHPIPVGLATYISLVLFVADGISWNKIELMTLLNHLFLILLSFTTSFSVFAYYRYKFYKAKPDLLFYDNFHKSTGWINRGDGKISITDETSYSLKHCLKKDGASDPHGGYKKIGRTISANFVFSGWIYAPFNRGKDAYGDRIAIEDKEFNGYGFAVAHGGKFIEIERREHGIGQTIKGHKRRHFSPPIDQWYHFEFTLSNTGNLALSLFDSSLIKIVNIKATDTKYKKFDRIAIHGGYPYYIDDLKITTT